MKFFKSIVLSLMITATVLNSRPSQATVGAIFAGPAIVTAGLYMMAGGGAAVGVGTFACLTGIDKSSGGHAIGCGWSLMGGILGLMAGALGIIVLDGEQSVAFAPLNAESARDLGISKKEMLSFNNEIDQVNALASHVDQELARLAEPTVENSVAAWSEVKDAVSVDTFKVMQKVSAQLYK